MQRAKTLSGLFLQAFRVRWAALGRPGKGLVIVGLVLAAATALQFSACLFGACPSAAGPCDSPCSATAESDEPCPFSAAQAEETEAGAEAEHPPCHAE